MNDAAVAPAPTKPARKEPEVETIKMEDGISVDFAGKKKMLKSHQIDEHGKVHLRFDFRNGQVLKWTVPHALVLKFAGHGAEQKLGDQTAGVEDVDDMYLEVEELRDRLEKGGLDAWTVTRESSGMSGTSVLLKALVELTSKPVSVVKEYLKGLSQAEKVALRASEKVQPIVQRIEAAKANKGIDTSALLAKLGG
jgi:hypothetical protein